MSNDPTLQQTELLSLAILVLLNYPENCRQMLALFLVLLFCPPPLLRVILKIALAFKMQSKVSSLSRDSAFCHSITHNVVVVAS